MLFQCLEGEFELLQGSGEPRRISESGREEIGSCVFYSLKQERALSWLLFYCMELSKAWHKENLF